VKRAWVFIEEEGEEVAIPFPERELFEPLPVDPRQGALGVLGTRLAAPAVDAEEEAKPVLAVLAKARPVDRTPEYQFFTFQAALLPYLPTHAGDHILAWLEFAAEAVVLAEVGIPFTPVAMDHENLLSVRGHHVAKGGEDGSVRHGSAKMTSVEVDFLTGIGPRTEDGPQAFAGLEGLAGVDEPARNVGLARAACTEHQGERAQAHFQMELRFPAYRHQGDLREASGGLGFEEIVALLAEVVGFIAVHEAKTRIFGALNEKEIPGQAARPEDQEGLSTRRDEDAQGLRPSVGPLDTPERAHAGTIGNRVEGTSVL
jgi:hypothetical protein